MQIYTKFLSDDPRVTLTCYIQEPSKEMMAVAKKPAMLILPGGAYFFTSDREAEPIALAYASKGFQTFVLRYSVGKRAHGCKPLREASQAIGMIREHADEWFVEKDKVYTVGFSAGGHLSGWVGLCGEHKPNGAILGYPAVELFSDERKEERSRIIGALLGANFTDEEAEQLNLVNHIKEDSIPMFIWSTAEDVLTTPAPIYQFAYAYARANRPLELHMYQFGEHGYSLANHVTANGRKSLVDPLVEEWVDKSIEWIHRNFGRPEIVDKPHQTIEGIIDPGDMDY